MLDFRYHDTKREKDKQDATHFRNYSYRFDWRSSGGITKSACQHDQSTAWGFREHFHRPYWRRACIACSALVRWRWQTRKLAKHPLVCTWRWHLWPGCDLRDQLYDSTRWDCSIHYHPCRRSTFCRNHYGSLWITRCGPKVSGYYSCRWIGCGARGGLVDSEIKFARFYQKGTQAHEGFLRVPVCPLWLIIFQFDFTMNS